MKLCLGCKKYRNFKNGKMVFNDDEEKQMWLCEHCLSDIEPATSDQQLIKLFKSGKINFKK